MDITSLVIADKDADFLNKLSKYIIDKNLNFDVYCFSEKRALMDFIENEDVNLLIVDELFCNNDLFLNARADVKIILSFKKSFFKEGFHIIKKFQKAENLLNEIMTIYSNNGSNLKSNSVIQKEELKTKIACFKNTSGGVGTTTLALAFASNMSYLNNKTFYINLEYINSSECFLSSSKVILPEDIQNIVTNDDFTNIEKISILSQVDEKTGVTFFPINFNNEDKINLLIDLLQIIKNCNIYKYIVIDAGDFSNIHDSILELCNVIFLIFNNNKLSEYKMSNIKKKLSKCNVELIVNNTTNYESSQDPCLSIPIIDFDDDLDLNNMSKYFAKYVTQLEKII